MEYLNFCYRKNVIFNTEMQNFFNLSKTLERNCLIFIHKDMLMKVPLFSSLTEQEILRICQKLKTRVFMPDEQIFDKGEFMGEIYFIL